MLHRGAFAFASASLLALSWASAAVAADAPKTAAATIEELVVTAQRREESVKDVPLSINVIGAQQLERQQVYNIFDLSRIAPSLELTNAAGQNPGGGGQVRGIGTQSFGVGAVGSVGIVVDGVSQGNVNIADLFDIGRIEVLKGPQGTLFGLTTSAGVINITTNAPDFTKLSGRLRTEFSDEGTVGSGYGQQVVQGALNIPISDIAGLRVAGNYNHRQGPNRNALDGSLDHHDSYGGRARLLVKPTEALTINLNADYNKSKGDGPDFFTLYKADPALTAQLLNCSLGPGQPPHPIRPTPSNRDYCTTAKTVDGSKIYGGSVGIDYALEAFTLTSITAARRSRSVPLNGLDIFRLRNTFFVAPNVPGFPGFNPTRPIVPPQPTDIFIQGSINPAPTDLVTQEIRIASPAGARVEYTMGLFYSNQTGRNSGGGTTTVTDFPAPGAPGIVLSRVVSTPSSNQDWSKAIFGQATFHLTEQLGLIAGGRYTKEVLKQTTVTAAGVAAKTRTSIEKPAWRFGAQYEVDPTLMTYATIARGYKGPQLAPPPTGSPAGTPSRVVAPEIPTDYEAGAKKVLFDGRVIADFSAFYIDVTNYQGQVCITDPVTNLLGCTVANFDGVKSRGLELNLFGRISDNFTVNSGLIWNKATYPSSQRNAAGVKGPYRGPDGTDLSGAQLVNAPKWKFTFSGEYSREVFDGLDGFLSADAVYKSRIRYAPSGDPALSYGSNIVLGGRLGVRSQDGMWSVAMFARNLTNEHVPVLRQTGFPSGANYGQFLSTGSFRVVGVNLEAGF